MAPEDADRVSVDPIKRGSQASGRAIGRRVYGRNKSSPVPTPKYHSRHVMMNVTALLDPGCATFTGIRPMT